MPSRGKDDVSAERSPVQETLMALAENGGNPTIGWEKRDALMSQI